MAYAFQVSFVVPKVTPQTLLDVLKPEQILTFSQGSPLGNFPGNGSLVAPKIELLGSILALVCVIGPTLVPFLATVVPTEALGIAIRISMDF